VGGLIVWLGRVDDPDALIGPPAPRSGAPAPEFSLVDLNGDTHSLADYRGQPVIINFWATWCPPCRAEMPDLQQVYEKNEDDGLVILAINQSESPNTVEDFADEYDLTFTIMIDNFQVSDTYEVMAYPSTYFIDRAGRIQHAEFSGPMSKSFIESQVLDLLD
jgi:peroxiredoxin